MTEFYVSEIPWRDPSPQIIEVDGGACDPCGEGCDDITVGRGRHADVNLCCLCAGHEPCDACDSVTHDERWEEFQDSRPGSGIPLW